jgi:hypothetical protein
MTFVTRVRLVASALTAIALLAPRASAADSRPVACGTGVHVGEERGLVFLPHGDVFCPLVADPKAIRSFLTYLRGKFPTNTERISVGSIGVGDGFSFFRIGGPASGDGLQLGLEAAVFAQFNLDAPSLDLINSDFLVGLPLTFRRSGFSARARVYHQSSHLGDEFLLATGIEREEIAFESLELILSQEIGAFRVYAGGEYLFDRTPSTLAEFLVHAGAEVRIGPAVGARFIAAADLKSSEEQDWKPAWSVRTGVEFAKWGSLDHTPRIFSLLAEFYEGPSPYGQFFLQETRYLGIGFHFLL